MNSDEVTSILNISDKPHAFTVGELLSSVGSDVDWQTLRDVLRRDPRYIHLGKEPPDEDYFIGEKALFLWFTRLSIRLAQARVARLSAERLAMLMSSLRLTGKWEIPPDEGILFGQRLGFVGHAYTPNQYVFPMAHVLSLLPSSIFQIAIALLESFAEIPKSKSSFEELLLKSVQDGFSNFSARVKQVVQARKGLLEQRKMTLEQIGTNLRLTRERVRQLEMKFWGGLHNPQHGRRLIRPFIVALLCDVMRKHGSLILRSDSPDAPMRRFIAQCAGIPEAIVPHTKIVVLGALPKQLTIPETAVSFPSTIDTSHLAALLESSGQLCLIDSDLKKVVASIAYFHEGRLTKTQKAYLALRAIGKPAHYSKVTKVYNSMFPDDPVTENNIHAVLNRGEHGIVWIGSRGTFGLKEWGYEHPSTTLFDTVTEIVKEKFEETGKPVPFEVILAEIGKYRQVVKPASIVFATQCNPTLRRIFKDSFVPRDSIDEAHEDISAEELDRILREFEKHRDNKE